MIFYGEKNVYEAGLERIRYIFDEFYGKRPIIVTISGGKDSTVTLYLVHEIMVERGIEKIPVLFLDQEAEAPQTIDYIREIMHLPWVEPYWVQSFFREWNASKGEWFNVWGPGEQWCREKEPNNPYANMELTTNKYFTKTLGCVQHTIFGKSFVSLGGVRIEESPARLSGLTHSEVIKGTGITWGNGGGYYKNGEPKAMVLYPIWDWKCNDVWYYIFSNRIPYCKLYDYLFSEQALKDCRVSSLIHEQAIKNLEIIRRISPDFYERLQRRVKNVNSTVQVYAELIHYINWTFLPKYFNSWEEYVDYLADNLVGDKSKVPGIKRGYHNALNKALGIVGKWEEGRVHVTRRISQTVAICILSEDFELKRIQNIQRTLHQFYNENYEQIQKANKE